MKDNALPGQNKNKHMQGLKSEQASAMVYSKFNNAKKKSKKTSHDFGCTLS